MVGRRRSPSVEVVVSSSLSCRHISRALKHKSSTQTRHGNVEALAVDRASLTNIETELACQTDVTNPTDVSDAVDKCDRWRTRRAAGTRHHAAHVAPAQTFVAVDGSHAGRASSATGTITSSRPKLADKDTRRDADDRGRVPTCRPPTRRRSACWQVTKESRHVDERVASRELHVTNRVLHRTAAEPGTTPTCMSGVGGFCRSHHPPRPATVPTLN